MVRRATAESLSAATRCVVVGASVYDNGDLRPLPAAAAEAIEIAAALAAPEGLAIPPEHVVCLTGRDATTNAVQEALRNASESSTPHTTLVLYFAGHGVSFDGGGFGLCLRDSAAPPGPESTVSSDFLQRLLADCDARGILCILDCCGGAALAERAPAMFNAVSASDFRILLSASRGAQSSWETAAGSLFSRHLLRALRGEVALTEDVPGCIYFNELYKFLHDSVLEEREARHRSLPIQEPVFAGSYVRDPLLFVHGKLSRAQLVVRMQRYSRDYVRRALLRVVSTLALLLVASAGLYWSYMDQTEHVRLRDDGLQRRQGHPTLQGFGLPRDVWTYDVMRDEIASASPLAGGGTLISRPGRSVVGMIAPNLTEPGRVRWLWLTGERRTAQTLLRQIVDARESRSSADLVRMAQLLGAIADRADLPRLTRLLGETPQAYRRDLARDFVRIGQQPAFQQLMTPATGRPVAGLAAQALTELSDACHPALQASLDEFAAGHAQQGDVPAVYYVTTITGCRMPLALLGRAWPAHQDVVAGALLTAYPEMVARVVESATAKLELAAKGKRPQSDVGSVVSLLTLLPSGRCPAFPDLSWVDPRWRFEVELAVVVARSCTNRTLSLTKVGDTYQLGLEDGATGVVTPIRSLAMAGRDDSEWVDLIHAMDLVPIRGAVEALLICAQAQNESLARAAMIALYDRKEPAPASITRTFETTYQELMIVALAYWATTHRESVLRTIIERLDDGAAGYVPGILSFLELSDAERALILHATASERVSPTRRATLVTMFGAAPDALRSLCSPIPAERHAAKAVVAFRADLDQLRRADIPQECGRSWITEFLGAEAKSRADLSRLLSAGPAALRGLRARMALFYHPTRSDGLRMWLRQGCLSCV
jgi:hypothetical protein